MDGEIGDAAGVIWRNLERHGETTLSTLTHGTKLSDQRLLMGVAWLAREDKLGCTRAGRTLKIRLKERSAGNLASF